MKTRFAVLFLVTLLIAAPARAEDFSTGAEAETGGGGGQQPNTGIRFVKNQTGAVFYLMLGNNSLDLDALNNSLKANNYSTVDKNFVMIGVGGHAVISDWIAGGELHFMNPQKVSSGTHNLNITGGYLTANIGYVARRSENYIIYPMVGAGFGTLSLNIQSTGSASFDQVLANPGRGAQLTYDTLVFNVAVAADGFAPLTESGDTHVPFIFGFRAGYLFSSPLGGWQSPEGEVGGGPSSSFTGPYLQIVVGLGFMNG